MSGRHHMILAEVAAMDAGRGDRDAAAKIFAELDERARTRFVSPAALATIAASAGLLNEARTLLAEAIKGRDGYLGFLKLAAWRSIWADPACAALVGETAYIKNAMR
jgi:hypothetical protein